MKIISYEIQSDDAIRRQLNKPMKTMPFIANPPSKRQRHDQQRRRQWQLSHSTGSLRIEE